MKEAVFCFSVDDVAYDGYSTEENLSKLIDFCDGFGMKPTWFTVPFFGDIDFRSRKEYIRILKNAIANGHEVGQHGLRHDRFETGVPPPFIMSLPHEGPAREELAKNSDLIDKNNSVENIRTRLAQGKEILEDALGIKIQGFRAGAGSNCPNLFVALAEDGYLWDSSCIVQEAGWDLIQGQMDAVPHPITRERLDALQFKSSLKELPIYTDYTWYLTKDRYDASLSMAKHDFAASIEAGIPFVPVCHVSPIFEGDSGLGFKLFTELHEYAKELTSEKGIELKYSTISDAVKNLWK